MCLIGTLTQFGSIHSTIKLVSGIKSNYETSGVDGSVRLNDCKASLNKSHHVESILKWAQDANMATGFVTTTRYMDSYCKIWIFFSQKKKIFFELLQCGSCNTIGIVCAHG